MGSCRSTSPRGRTVPTARRVLALAGLLLVAGGPASEAETAAGPAPGADALAGRLDAVLGRKALRDAKVGALVMRASDGGVVYAHAADAAFVPASNAKILTAIAALSAFGPTHRFETPVFADRAPDADGAVGYLAVRGVGDPALNSEDWWMIANELRRKGLRRIEGDLILDDLAFDAERWNPTWRGISSRAYHAPVGALTANYGAFSVTVLPGLEPGAPARVALDPPLDFFQLENRARTVPSQGKRRLAVDRTRAEDGEKVVVSGMLRLGDEPSTYYRSVLDPTLYAGSVLRMQLAAVGIRFDGKLRVGGVPSDAQPLLAFEGRPLREIVRLFVKYSNNAVAETLVKALGARESGAVGTWSSGIAALRHELLALGLAEQDFSLVDGSGLSYDDRVTPRGLVRALAIARRSFAFGPELVSSLPIANGDGTLEERAAGAAGSVRAKTGLLNGITSLSGYAHPRGGSPGDVLVFSILVNGHKVSDGQAMQAVDQFAAELVRGVELAAD